MNFRHLARPTFNRCVAMACGTAVLAWPAAAVAAPSLTARPNPVDRADPLTITGRGWPVFENCERRVRLTLSSDQNSVAIGTARVGERGGFKRRWVPSRSNVGPGRWRIVARMRCESGRDGSPVAVVRRVDVRIR